MTREEAVRAALSAFEECLLWAEWQASVDEGQLVKWNDALDTARAKLVKRVPLPPDEARARVLETKRAYQARWRANNPERAREIGRRYELRKAARVEAAATGQPVETIYARWGVM